jgi:hypothetical protein
VLGYDPNELDPKYFESTSVIVEAKMHPNTDGTDGVGIPPVIAYMVGIQQQRMRLEEPKRIVDPTYGILSDGINWHFFRLSGNFRHLGHSLHYVQQIAFLSTGLSIL